MVQLKSFAMCGPTFAVLAAHVLQYPMRYKSRPMTVYGFVPVRIPLPPRKTITIGRTSGLRKFSKLSQRRALSSPSSVILKYWICDSSSNDDPAANDNEEKDFSDENCPADDGLLGWSSSMRIQREIEELESARRAFEALLEDCTNDGIQDDGIVTAASMAELGEGSDRSTAIFARSTNSVSRSSSNSLISESWPQHQRYKPQAENPAALVDRLLTNTGRSMRELEIKLLEELAKCHDGSAEDALIHFWTTERDCYAANDLLRMAHHPCSQNLQHEEIKLRTMTEAYPTWAEPFCRLASLFYYKQQYEAAEQMATFALKLKPWHFEAIRMRVLTSLQLGKNNEAMYWSSKQLPRLQKIGTDVDMMDGYTNKKQRRVNWVEQAISDAKQQLHDAETFTHQYYLHKNQERAKQKMKTSSPCPHSQQQQQHQREQLPVYHHQHYPAFTTTTRASVPYTTTSSPCPICVNSRAFQNLQADEIWQ